MVVDTEFSEVTHVAWKASQRSWVAGWREGTGEAGNVVELEGVQAGGGMGHLETDWVGLCLPRRYIEVLTPSTSGCDPIWK